MNYKCTFFNNIYGIELDIKNLYLVKEFELRIGTDEKIISDFFTEQTTIITGLSQFEQSVKLKSFIYSKFEIKKTDLNEENLLAYIQSLCCTFSHSLWLIKDSSVRFNLGHLKYKISSIWFVNAKHKTIIMIIDAIIFPSFAFPFLFSM